ncbi:chemotaxis protein [Rhizobium sp. CG5]|nr:chemotaxis protein [Rhizobium sp. CG5]
MRPFRVIVLAALGLASTGPLGAQTLDSIEPFRMLRSLQFVQDSVVLGDHSAADMQRFMLETIDSRLRSSDASVFEEPRNVDAALIYAMSGGNPATLEFLVARDVDGNFDNRVTDALRKYLSGKGTLIAKSLAEMVPEYRDQKIGPYLALVAGNVTITRDPAAALKFYDWARLTAPGTIVEEAALRRSLSITLDTGMVEKGAAYSNRYARRFLHSPYASQFADLFVRLVVDHFDKLDEQYILTTLSFMDEPRQREVYLRIARQAAINGNTELARLGASHAKALSGQVDDGMDALADLYGGVADVSTGSVEAAMQAILDISDENLSPSDRALRTAAQAVAEEVLRLPVMESPTQADSTTPVAVIPETASDDPTAMTAAERAAAPVPVADKPAGTSEEGTANDPAFQSFVDTGRSKLEEIDKLLNEESATR